MPAFKLKQNGGKAELVRDAAIGPKYYGGWTAFVKAAVSFQGDFTFLQSPAEAPLHLYYISGDAGVSLGRVDEGARVEPKPWKAVAAVPASAEKAFSGLKTMAAASFAQTAAAKGGAHLQL